MPKQPTVPTSSSAADRPADEEVWPRVTREVADDLAADALARDRAGKPPFDEMSRLREAGLPSLLMPPGPSAHGSDWRTACAVIREIATADSSIGELLGRHYVLSWSARFFSTPEQAARLEQRSRAEQWLWGGDTAVLETEAGPDLTLAPTDNGYVLNGRRAFATGVAVTDRLALAAVCTDTGESLLVVVDPAHPGVLAEPANDPLGQRLAGAGSIDFDNVPVHADQVLGPVPRDEHAISPFASLAPLALRLVLLHVGLGIAEGALAEARDINRIAPRRWPHTSAEHGDYPDRPGGDPYLLLAYGELVTAAHTAAAVVERATEALTQGLLTGRALGIDARADIAVLVAAAEAVTNRSVMHITTRILELTDGADSAADGPGFDRFWRNARVLTARGSASHSLRDIGDHYLNGMHPALTLHA